MKCRNGLHEIDPDDEWRSSQRQRCRECRKANKARYNASKNGKEIMTEAKARYRATEKGKAARARYLASEKGKAAEIRANDSQRGRAAKARYAASSIQVRTAGTSTTIRVPPERKEEFQLRLAGFREQQADEYREHFAS
jgi:hypothetical protein